LRTAVARRRVARASRSEMIISFAESVSNTAYLIRARVKPRAPQAGRVIYNSMTCDASAFAFPGAESDDPRSGQEMRGWLRYLRKMVGAHFPFQSEQQPFRERGEPIHGRHCRRHYDQSHDPGEVRSGGSLPHPLLLQPPLRTTAGCRAPFIGSVERAARVVEKSLAIDERQIEHPYFQRLMIDEVINSPKAEAHPFFGGSPRKV
jgi:hypothetical protein